MSMPTMKVRDVSLFVEVIGDGAPLVLMHGGPGADHHTLHTFRRCADQFTLIFYDHRCNGRSQGPPVTSMTWGNLTADADALRQALGLETWAVLGHSFGGYVALEYALRYPESVSGLVLLDTGAESWWARDHASEVVLQRGYGQKKAELVRRFFHGDFAPRDMFWILMRIGDLYAARPSLRAAMRDLIHGEWRTKIAPDAMIFAARNLLDGWSVTSRLGEIHAPTLVIAGQQDFLKPPDCQKQLVSGIPGARLLLVDGAGHNSHTEQPDVVIPAIRDFLASLLLDRQEAAAGAGQSASQSRR
jgi:pimeloyl-ACP methyl ester carboxylesterase